MLRLFILAASLAAVFASTFLIFNATGLITLDSIKNLLTYASQVHPVYIGLAITFLLFLDMFIAMPTLTIATLAGYFMGPVYGAVFSILGMWAAGISGYGICRTWGNGLLIKIYKDETKLAEMQTLFNQYGAHALVFCRATPILPEVTCCLAGANNVSFVKFFLFYSMGTVPYACIAAFAGSQSTLDAPLPGIISAIGLSLTLWLCWFLLIRHARNLTNQQPL